MNERVRCLVDLPRQNTSSNRSGRERSFYLNYHTRDPTHTYSNTRNIIRDRNSSLITTHAERAWPDRQGFRIRGRTASITSWQSSSGYPKQVQGIANPAAERLHETGWSCRALRARTRRPTLFGPYVSMGLCGYKPAK